MSKWIWAVLVAVLVGSNSPKAEAVLGADLFATSGEITVELLETDAAYLNDLRLFNFAPAGTHLLFNHDVPGTKVVFNSNAPGALFPAGTFASGDLLQFGIVVNDPLFGVQTYYTGDGSKNPDGLVHADVVPDGSGYIVTVNFEDLHADDPQYDGDFNDTRFRFTGVELPVVPEPGTLALMSLGLLGFVNKPKSNEPS